MGRKWLVWIALSVLLASTGFAFAEIDGATKYRLDLTDAEGAGAKAKWSDPEFNRITPQGLAWGASGDAGSRDVWLQTEAIGIGLSWRPTTIADITVTIRGPGKSDMLYARYSADGKHWTSWQYLEPTNSFDARRALATFKGTLRVPYRESAAYGKLRMEYARRADVAWSSDEEALAAEITRREPKFFENSVPFIGYVQFLYEAQLGPGMGISALEAQVNWFLGGKHTAPRNENDRAGRDVPWRFKAP